MTTAQERFGISRRRSGLVLAAAVVGAVVPVAQGADGTWVATAVPVEDAQTLSWDVPANWLNGMIPGSTAGPAGTSTDVALFNTAGAGTDDDTITSTVLVDAGRNIGGITFDIASGPGRTVGTTDGNALYLSAGGTIQVTAASNTTTNPALGAPVVLLGDATFASYSTNGSAGLKPNGKVTAGPGATGIVTLTLGGNNASGTLTSNSQFLGAISDGPGAKVRIVKTGGGVWDIRATAADPNTYTGGTVINDGAIRINGAGAVPAGGDYVINGTSSLRFSVSNLTARSVAVNTAVGYTPIGGSTASSPFSGSNAGVVLNLANDTGPALTMDMAGGPVATADVTLTQTLNLTGTVAGQGGVSLISGPAGFRVTYSRNIDLGNVDRTFAIADTPGVSTDMRMTGAITGPAGIIKTGAGTLKLEAGGSYAGTSTVQEGRLALRPSSWNPVLTGAGGAVLAGGRIELDYTPDGGTGQTFTSPYPDAVAALNAGRVRVSSSGGVAAHAETVAIIDDTVGQTVTLSRAFYGDTDLNGRLNADDYARVDRGRAMGLTGWANGDVNYDDVVNSADLFLIDRAFGTSGVPHAAWEAILTQRAGEFGEGYVQSLIAAVPEPTSMSLVAGGLLLGGKRRRR